MAVRARYTQTAANANVTATSTLNDSGVIMRAGNLGNTTRWTGLAIAPQVSPRGPVMFNSATLTNQLGYTGTLNAGDAGFNRWRVVPANTAGNFATMTANKYVVRRFCNELAGVANTVLRSAGTHFTYRRSIHTFFRRKGRNSNEAFTASCDGGANSCRKRTAGRIRHAKA